MASHSVVSSLAHPRPITTLLAGLALLFSFTAYAASIDSVRADLDEFKTYGDARFAPKTVERAASYLGAARLADKRKRTHDKQEAIDAAASALTEARQTAAGFRDKYSKLIAMADEAHDTVAAVSIAMQTPSAGRESPQQMIRDGDRKLDQMITSRERGELGKTQQLADSAEQTFRKARDMAIPWLAEMCDQELSRASRAGAKNYAPVLYQAARDKLAVILAYIQGVTRIAPERPVEALFLAREAKHMAEQVKLMRRHSGSHEEAQLAARDFRHRLAIAVGMHIDPNPLLADVPGKPLLDAVNKLKADLKRERRERDAERIALKQQYEQELQSKLQEQASEMAAAQHSQLSDIKDAFRAKLERETFEQKRQQRLKALFGDGDAEVLINIDGSLLVRLTGLQFASGHSKIEQKYYDLLGNLKQALEIYSDRDVRIEGHTDDQGDVKYNQKLSLKRAEAVRDFLIAAGTDGVRLKALGYGEVRPIASNEFPQGRVMNRRIDVIIDAPASK